jgi:iron complex transport system substrate-binding protein
MMLFNACTPTVAPVISPPLDQQSTDETMQVNVPKISANITDGCVETYAPELNYFPDRVKIIYTQSFTVEYQNNYKLVTVIQPGSKMDDQIQYLLVQCGTPPPDNYADIYVIYIPVKTMVSMSTSYLPFLDNYDLLNRLVAVDDITYVNNPTVVDMAKIGKLVNVGSGAGVNIEMLISLQPDLIMAYNSGIPDYDAYPKLKDAGLNVVLNGDNLETSPMSRAEWGKFIALFFNKEEQAEQLFTETVTMYEKLVKLAASAKTKPTVFVNVNYQGTWYMDGGNSYMAQLLEDAGATYLWADNSDVGEIMLSFEEVYNKAANADYWINTGFWNSAKEALADDERYGEFAAFKNNHIYNNNARSNANGGNDYFESGIANPDVILADLIKIFHPELLPDHQLYYYHQLEPLPK